MIRPMGSVIKSLSKERYKTAKSLCRNGFGVSKTHSHSIVPDGFGVISYRTRLTPFTSAVIRAVIFWSKENGRSATEAVIASTVLTARRITGHSNVRALSRTPTDLKSGIAVKYCHTCPSRPAFANSSRKIASDSRTASRRSRVIAPKQRTPRPGPGNGWR